MYYQRRNYMKRKKKRKLKKSVKKLLILIPIIAVIAMVCVYGFALKDVSYSSDLQQYSAEEVKAYLNAKKIDNTLLFWIKNKIGKSENIDLFEEYSVKMQNPMKVKIISYEKKLKGYIKIYNSFYQVDEDGKVLKITAVKPKDIPIITGLDISASFIYLMVRCCHLKERALNLRCKKRKLLRANLCIAVFFF